MKILIINLLILVFFSFSIAQTAQEKGSQTAKDGFKNEDAIRDKFNSWNNDSEAKDWLTIMGYKLNEIESVNAYKPHGYKADVEVKIVSKGTPKIEGISIKLVSSPKGFNQIDKRWLATYVKMWKIPKDVEEPLKLFLGEIPPNKPSRENNRMFLNELDKDSQTKILDFFTQNKQEIVSDLLKGDGEFSASWMMVAQKGTLGNRWKLVSIEDAIKHFSIGTVEITKQGSLKIGKITMQRKGGDGGRETAKQLQFKMNPAELF